MKAALNGVPQLSTLDGWWQEGYDGLSGWAISPAGESEDADAADADRLLPAAGGAGRSALLHPQRRRRPARLGGEDAARAAAGRQPVHRAAHGAGLRAGVLRSGDPGRGRRATTRPRHEAGRMATAPPRRAAPRPPLRDAPAASRSPSSTSTAEYFPYARTGGLAEAVSGLAQLPAGGRAQRPRDPPALPHGARRRAGPRAGRPAVPGADGRRAPRRRASSAPPAPRPGPQVFFIEHLRLLQPARHLRRERRGLSRQRPPLRLLRARGADRPAPARERPGPAPRPRLAHGARAGVPPHHARRRAVRRRGHDRAVGAQPGLPGTLPARDDARGRAAVGALQLAPARVVRQGELAQGRAGLRRLRDHGEPHAGRASCARRAAASACTTCSSGWATGSSGVLNGIDQREWDPATDPQITAQYSADDLEGKRRCKAALQRSFGLPQRRKTPLFGMTGRLVTQKGLDLILERARAARDRRPVRLPRQRRAALRAGAGRAGHRRRPNRIGVQLDFTDRLEHRLMAGADIFLMPSLYEPCGLTQMRAQRYGAPPIVRRRRRPRATRSRTA